MVIYRLTKLWINTAISGLLHRYELSFFFKIVRLDHPPTKLVPGSGSLALKAAKHNAQPFTIFDDCARHSRYPHHYFFKINMPKYQDKSQERISNCSSYPQFNSSKIHETTMNAKYVHCITTFLGYYWILSVLNHNWLVGSTPLKNICQLGIWFPIYVKIKMFQTTNQIIFDHYIQLL